MGLSVVICTKNEERNIARCLKSVHSIAEEIIVVDSNSTDKTEEICKTFSKVRFYQSDWKGFSKTKNYANSLATQDYILSLDADEELSIECQHDIEKKKSSLAGVYTINRMTNYCGSWIKHSGWFPDRHIRLFPRKGSEWVGDFVHETLKYDSELIIQDLKGIVPHYSYYTLDEHWTRINTYSNLGAEKYLDKSSFRLLLSMWLNPGVRFFRYYFLKLGFLDGVNGFIIASLSSSAVFLKYAKAYKLKQKNIE